MNEIVSDKITDIINKRDLQRRLEIDKKREDKKHELAENENVDFFLNTFLERKNEIDRLLDTCDQVPSNKLTEHFDVISKKILSLQKYVASSNIFLRTYDIKRYQESLQNLTVRMKAYEDVYFPKKKFGFKNKTKLVALENQTIDEVDFAVTKPIGLTNTDDYAFENRCDEILTLYNEKIFKRNVTVRNLKRCVIKLYGNCTTLHMSQLTDCLVLSGPVSTSIFAENCINCKFVIACQQLRLHTSEKIDIYLHVTSRAIIEDCNKIFLAPYNNNYDGIETDFNASGLDMKINHWNSIDDFNWLNAQISSPHWSILPEDKRINDWKSYSLIS